MPRYIFDTETNGLLEELTKVHCLVLRDPANPTIKHSYADQPGYPSIREGLKLLSEADEVIGHNIIKFDLPAILKVYPDFKLKASCKVTDTLVISRVIWADMASNDLRVALSRAAKRQPERLPKKLFGRHSLESWGHRLGEHKGDYKGGWEVWSLEMQVYCEQDIEVTAKLYALIQSKKYSGMSLRLEHEFATVITMQETYGFPFDMAGALTLYGTLSDRRNELEVSLRNLFDPWWLPDREKDPTTKKYRNVVVTPPKTLAYKDPLKASRTAGAPFTPITYTEFNPRSRDHISNRLMKLYGWKPIDFGTDGKATVDEEVLAKLPYPPARVLTEHAVVQKRIAQLAEGNQAWIKLERKGRIHGSVNTNGAVTGRCTHMYPNVAQTPAVGVPYGKECRSLFGAPKGYKLVGADASGLELRGLAHFMAPFDKGAYTKLVTEGDVHWANATAMGLVLGARDPHNQLGEVCRNGAKTFIYGFLYGAGDEKAGRIVFDICLKAKALGLPFEDIRRTFFGEVNRPTEADFKRAGKRLKEEFLEKTPALKKLRDKTIKEARQEGCLIGIDGRVLHIRSPHAALNTLLQSAGALAVKKATVLLYQDLSTHGWVFGKDWALVAHIHDELQMVVKEGLEDELGTAAVNAIRRAGEAFGFNCPLDGEYKVGRTWADTH